MRAQAEHDQSSGPLQDGLNPDGKRRWLIWGSVAMGTFIATFDTSVVNVSLPTIAQTFGMTLVDIQWVELAYMLMVAIFLLPFGHLADLIGRRKVCVAGFGLFALGLFGAGLSTAIGGLLASRVLQAIGGAAFMANGPAIITETFLRDRGKAFGAITVVVSLGSILGPLCGGWLTQHWGWSWIFWINIPAALVAMWWAMVTLPGFQDELEHHWFKQFDAYGGVLIAVALSALILRATYGMTRPWLGGFNGACTLALLGAIGLFIKHHRHAQRGERGILVNFSTFTDTTFFVTAAASFLSFIGIKMVFFLVPFYLETVRSMGPFTSGAVLMSAPLALSVAAPLSGAISDRFGGRAISALGMLCSALGLFLISRFEAATPLWLVVCGLALVGAGNGIFYPPNSARLVSSAPVDQLGIVGGLQAIVRTMGMLFAVVLIGALYVYSQSALQEPATTLVGQRLSFTVAALLTLFNVGWLQFDLGRGRVTKSG
ncbi:MAG: MFS transporter [Cyanobacteria bacterium HKST-UBA05]|nr:MFS transporter [Cyanobacteria bacterium HKST-UBA05]